jgi:ectoine hydroxylase-related dioxygenase (phytanoyl-CoA dioxygenase family)
MPRSALPSFDCRRDERWLEKTLAALSYVGVAVVEDVLSAESLEGLRSAMYRTFDAIKSELGQERLDRAGEAGVLRLMFRHDPLFFSVMELPEVLAVVDGTVSETAVLHVQNGFILPSGAGGSHQHSFHRDFPRYLDGYVASVNTLIAIDEFTPENGATIVVPGTHQRSERPDDAYLAGESVAVECPAGSMLVFDSTLWHAAGVNQSGRDRLGINQQFTRSFFKQQLDCVRALGADVIQAQSPRTQQLLGWYTRVPTSLDEYYRPAEERLYRAGQG